MEDSIFSSRYVYKSLSCEVFPTGALLVPFLIEDIRLASAKHA